MSTNWFKDMQDMHIKYGVNKWVQAEKQSDVEIKRFNQFMDFRINMMQEELDETRNAFINKDPEEIVDGIIDWGFWWHQRVLFFEPLLEVICKRHTNYILAN